MLQTCEPVVGWPPRRVAVGATSVPCSIELYALFVARVSEGRDHVPATRRQAYGATGAQGASCEAKRPITFWVLDVGRFDAIGWELMKRAMARRRRDGA